MNNITGKNLKENHYNSSLSKVIDIKRYESIMEEEDMVNLNKVKNILDIEESMHPEFTLAKNKARFKKKLVWYKNKKAWLDIAPVQKINKLFKQQTRELESIRSSKMDYEMELETASLTPSQRSYRKDELKMCRAHEKMAIQLISKMQLKFKSQSGN
ncbi:MAG: hypothetical protein GDA46_02590 [Bdellovibrionales bacterium]|nr:hypothetical protein [Bdellovibrionales bacterium]